MLPLNPWLSDLESEAIEILREGMATAARPVMLYSGIEHLIQAP